MTGGQDSFLSVFSFSRGKGEHQKKAAAAVFF